MPSVQAQLPFVQLHGIFQSEVKRVAYQCMPYRYFVYPGDLFFKIAQVVHIQVVSRINAEPQCFSLLGGCYIRGDGFFFIGGVLFGIGFRIQFYPVGSGCGAPSIISITGSTKMDADACMLKYTDDLLNNLYVLWCPAMIAW